MKEIVFSKYKVKKLDEIATKIYPIFSKDVISIDYESFTNIKNTKDPTFQLAELDDVIIETDTFTIKKEESYCYENLYYHTLKKNLNIVGNNIFLVKNFKPIVRYKGKFLLLGGHSNYYHWFFNWFPRLKIFQKLKNFKEYKLIVNFDITQFQLDSLKMVGIEKEQLHIIDQNYQNNFEKVIAMSIFDIPNHSFTVVNYLRSLFVKIDLYPDKKKKIYITRNNSRTRHVTNEKEVIKLIEKYDYEVIELEKLTFAEQVLLFSSVSHIISPHGASLTNMIFTNNYINVIELQNERHHTNVYRNLSLVCSSKRYEILKCDDSDSSNKAAYLRDMKVDILRLEEKLKKMLIHE